MFVIEALIKIISFGFICNGDKSYLRTMSNLLDFVIVLSAIATKTLSGAATSSLSILKVFRVLRVLRPLRFISRSEGLNLAINSLV